MTPLARYLPSLAACLLLPSCSSTATNTDTSQERATEAAAAVGGDCTLADESKPAFSSFAATELNVEDRTTQCGGGMCLAVNFQGRKSCPYGGTACTTPEGDAVSVNVPPQLVARPPSDAVYCSCRCDGPENTGPFCACPGGFECKPLVADFGFGDSSLAGSYCLKAGTSVDDASTLASGPVCDPSAHNCDDR